MATGSPQSHKAHPTARWNLGALSLTETSMGAYLRKAEPEGWKADGTPLYYHPLCRGHRKLDVDWQKGVWFCYKCGKGGAVHTKRRPSGGPVWEEKGEPRFDPARREGLLWRYLSDTRGLTRSEIADLRPHSGADPFRVYFPVYALGRTSPCYWVGRSILQSHVPAYLEPRISSVAYRKSDVLWGLHRIQGTVKSLTICEGVFDAVHDRSRLALLGKRLSPAQAEILSRIDSEEITILLDGDAIYDTYAALRILSHRYHGAVYIVELPIGTDPDELGEKVEGWIKRRARVA